MEDTEQVEESEYHAQISVIGAFYRVKMNLKAAIKIKKETEKEAVETEEYLELKSRVKELNDELKQMKEDALDDLESDELYIDIRKIVIEAEEEFAHQRETVATALEALPVEPIQMVLDLGIEGESMVSILSQKHLFIGGEDQKI